MADFTERIKIIIDTVADGAKAGLSSFKTSVSEAEGFTGKFKAGASSAFDVVKNSAGLLAVAGGAALLEFGVKSLEAFEHTAIAARDLSTATGLTVEDASRWIGVAKDMNVSADGLTAGLGRIAKTLDDTKWKQYGIDTRDAAGEALPVNDILLQTADVLSHVENETQRATIGNDLFGKGFKTIAPLMSMSREELAKYLSQVEKGQVITEGELSSAEKSEQAQKKLSQAMGELGLTAGQLLTKLTPVITIIAKTVGVVVDLANAYVDLVFTTKDTGEATKGLAKEIDSHHVGLGNVIADFKQLVNEHSNARSGLDKTRGFFNVLSGAEAESEGNLRDFMGAFKELAETSPAAAEEVASGFDAIKKAADAGDPSAKALIHTYDLTSDSLAKLHKIAADAELQQTGGILTTKQQKAAQEEQQAATDAQTAATALYQKQQTDLNKVVADAKKRDDDYTKSLEDIQKAQLDLIPHTEDLEQATRDVDTAYHALQGQEAENIKTQKDHKTSTDDKAQSTRDLESSEYSLVQQLLTTAKTYADSRGDIDGSTTSIQDQINHLEIAKGKYPELAAEIDKYIAKLKEQPAAVNTDVTLHLNAHVDNIIVDGETHAAGATGNIHVTGGNVRQSASGGPRSGAITVDEMGREIIHVPPGTTVEGANSTAHEQPTYVDQSTTINHFPPGISISALIKADNDRRRRGAR